MFFWIPDQVGDDKHHTKNMADISLKLLSDFVSIQSVSTDPSRHSEILKAVEFLKKEIKSLGFEVNIYKKKGCPPLIIGIYRPASTKVSKVSARQVGIYAHYDVQPEDPVGKWGSPPFELTRRNGKLFGRGVADDKGHIIQIIEAIRRLVETRHASSLHNNIVLIFEGEEENASGNFEELINQARKDLENIDVFYILDMGMKAKNIPQIFYGLRGIIAGELKIKIGETDLHSGVYGNRVLNPVQIIAELLVKIKDGKTHQIKIPSFNDRVKEISQKEMEKSMPSFEVNGIKSGYTGDGTKTIIPCEATLKFSIRLVPNQKAKEIKKIVEDFIKNNLPKEVDFTLELSDGGDPFYTDFENPYSKKTAEILADVFKNKTYFNRSGGSIAAAEILQRVFAKPVILTGFTLDDCNIHAPNENIDCEMFEKGITALQKILRQ